MLSTRIPIASSRPRRVASCASLERSTACTAVPKRLVFSTSSKLSSARIASTGRSALTSTMGRPRKTPLTSEVVPMAVSRPA